MSDPLRTDAPRQPDGPTEADREARIEQLLLSGLDQYFAGQYEQAINIWTRVVFLERGHSCARAYIERARGALAERHRESDELLHRGIAAFNSGQTEAARDLITRAVEQGGTQDVALVLLERLNRLAAPAAPAEPLPAVPIERRGRLSRDAAVPAQRSRASRGAVALAVASVVAVIAVLNTPVTEWILDPVGPSAAQVTAMPPDPLPVATASERLIARARALQSGGHLYDALRALDAIDIGDPVRPEADRLKGDIQRQLLEAGATERPR